MNSYGLTEASTCTVLPDEMALTRPDSIGRPIEGVEMCIIDEDDGLILDEREGEICIRGAHVFVGYRHRPLATNAVLVNGWLRTGDLGHRDADGFYYLHGRKDDVINCAGHKVTPVEIESCIMQLPAVAEVVVVGQAHRILGEVVKAVVVPRAHGDLDKKQITQHCARHLASHKIPFFVEFVSALPKTSTGKPLRRKLKETAP